MYSVFRFINEFLEKLLNKLRVFNECIIIIINKFLLYFYNFKKFRVCMINELVL